LGPSGSVRGRAAINVPRSICDVGSARIKKISSPIAGPAHVPIEPAAGLPAAEPVEPRAGTRNAGEQRTHRTQSRACVPQALERVRQVLPSSTRGKNRILNWVRPGLCGQPSKGPVVALLRCCEFGLERDRIIESDRLLVCRQPLGGTSRLVRYDTLIRTNKEHEIRQPSL
jgi:hypothetical protein